MNNNYYPLKRVKDKLGEEVVSSMVVQPLERRHWLYNIANGGVVVETDHKHDIINIECTQSFKGLSLSLKRAKKNGEKICWYNAK